MDDGNLTNDLPVWWPYPASCGQGHPWGPGKIIVTFRPCTCLGGELGAGHTIVACRADGCGSAWYRPAHDPHHG
jgi:hypothetical protein